ncbi:MAG: hypothetical protein ACTHLK_23130 [Brucella intermedia]
MLYTPKSTQISGAVFLAKNTNALLADEPRVGKTGAAIIGADLILAKTILVVTTASGRGVWKRGFADWSVLDRSVQIALPKDEIHADVVIVGWTTISHPKLLAALLSRKWDLLLSDEDHFAKSFDAARTRAMYGELHNGGEVLNNLKALYARAARVWPLTGTPQPHDPGDWYPRMRALCPERLKANPEKGWPDVTSWEAFRYRYCIVKPKKISNFRKILVVIGGQNLGELKERLQGFFMLRTQKDVGIQPPVYELLPLVVTDKQRKQAEGDLNRTTILKAAAEGNTRDLDMHLGPLRRITGEIKAHAVVDAVKEEFDCGLDKIVLAYWHKEVGKVLMDGLSRVGVVGIDGATPSYIRQKNEDAFRDPKGPRVFLAQIEAAGEAIDLSASAVLWFVETVFSPKSMKQMSLRVTNHTQARQAVVKVCVLEGSIDEALQASLLRLWTAIREVIS